jgi:serine phosphatase RsbU (regulator of sigma subunit)
VADRYYVDYEEPLLAGMTVILCTDGLIERRGEPLEIGIERLCRASSAHGEPGQIADVILDRLMPNAEHDDDVALLVARVVFPA